MLEETSDSGKNIPHKLNLLFGEEVEIEEAGFSFHPISGFEIEIDGSVYMYSDDGNLEINLLGGEVPQGRSISELNNDLSAELMENFDNYDLFDAGTETIQGISGFLNDIRFFNAEEEGFGRTLICSPQINQYFFVLMIASAEYWQQYGNELFKALKSKIRFHPQFLFNKEESKRIEHPDLTIETYEDIPPDEEFLLRIEKGDISLLIAARSYLINDKITLLDITEPHGKTIYHFDADSSALTSLISEKPLISTNGELCVFYPQNNQQALRPGEYKLSFDTQTGSPLQDIQVIIRTGRALNEQSLDINFWIAIENELFGNSNYFNHFEEGIRKALNHRLSPLNLRIGNIKCFHPAPDVISAFTILNVDTDLADCSYMINETIDNGRALNVGLLDHLIEGHPPKKANIQAVSSGHPGMILTPASPHACIVIGWSGRENDTSFLAEAILEQLVYFSGINTRDTPLKSQPLLLNHEIAWRLRQHPIFYRAN